MPSSDVIRIANMSGFYGDRFDAPREMLTGRTTDGHQIDVLTGDYLAELTMMILWRTTLAKPDAGYAKTFVHQMRACLTMIAEQGTKVVVNAGGLNPAGLAQALRELAVELDVVVPIAHVEGDDLMGRIGQLAADHEMAHLDTGASLAELPNKPLTANAYLGGWGIAAALDAGAQIVVTGRVTDASLVLGPAAWHFGWARDDWDALAGAVVAGHIIECGCQATGGNYSFFTEVPGLEHPGFPIAELHADGSSVITKHEGTGGLVDVGTVTAQLLYEIGGPLYLNPDVTTDFGSIRLVTDGFNRVKVAGVTGAPPPNDLKVCLNTLGGFKNEMTFVLTGMDVAAKAALMRRTVEGVLDLASLDSVSWQLIRTDQQDAPTNEQAVAHLRLVVKDADQAKIGRRAFSSPLVELALATYPGATFTAPPADAQPYGIYVPTLVPRHEVAEVVVLPDGARLDITQTTGGSVRPVEHQPLRDPGQHGRTSRVPLGTLIGARSGDKGGNANIGLWARSDQAARWLAEVCSEAWVRELLPETGRDDVEGLAIQIHHLPNLRAVNIVIEGLLEEGVSSSSRQDPQAKGLGEYLRSRHVDIPVDLLE